MGGHCTAVPKTSCPHGCDRTVEFHTLCLGPDSGVSYLESGLLGDLRDSHAMMNHLLLKAAQEGCVEAILACIDRGANVETRRPFAMSPDAGVSPDEACRGLTPLMYAAQNGNYDACKVLLELFADANAEDEDGMRPLHFAAAAGSMALCGLLLDYKADIHAQDVEGRVAFDMLPLEDVLTRREVQAWREVLLHADVEGAGQRAAVRSAEEAEHNVAVGL